MRERLHDAASSGSIEDLKRYVDEEYDINAKDDLGKVDDFSFTLPRSFSKAPKTVTVSEYFVSISLRWAPSAPPPLAPPSPYAQLPAVFLPYPLPFVRRQKFIDGSTLDLCILLNSLIVYIYFGSGRTPLYLAAMFGHIEACHLLVTKGADINIANKRGNTVFSYQKILHIDIYASPPYIINLIIFCYFTLWMWKQCHRVYFIALGP